ncbi:MAG: BLUF domain-containing protein [Alphaproteobacteria bacterium]|nr:MAG: BLUF domain-containing protein [Alphaproteobacteria bacterium]
MLSRFIYSSTRQCTDEVLSQILADARDFNARNDLSGAFYLFGHTFIQYLEGDDLVIDALWRRIQPDSRHAQCRLLDQRLVMLRLFQGWSMTWLVRTPETDHLVDLLLPHPTQSDDMNGSLAASLFLALSKAAAHK